MQTSNSTNLPWQAAVIIRKRHKPKHFCNVQTTYCNYNLRHTDKTPFSNEKWLRIPSTIAVITNSLR